MFGKRGTGRTTRMLADAKRLAAEGRAVYVIAANESHRLALARMADCHPRDHWPKFETPESLGSGFDWSTLWSRGAHPNCVFLVDHYAIETRFFRLLQMFHQYDE